MAVLQLERTPDKQNKQTNRQTDRKSEMVVEAQDVLPNHTNPISRVNINTYGRRWLLFVVSQKSIDEPILATTLRILSFSLCVFLVVTVGVEMVAAPPPCDLKTPKSYMLGGASTIVATAAVSLFPRVHTPASYKCRSCSCTLTHVHSRHGHYNGGVAIL